MYGTKAGLNTQAWVDDHILQNTTAHAVIYACGIMPQQDSIDHIII